MRIGKIEVTDGQKHFCLLDGPPTRGGFSVNIPLHVIVGAKPGPRLVIQAGVSGLEIEPAMTLPKVVEEIDPAHLAGTLVVVPLMNTSGFEFEQVEAVWDNQNLNELGAGNANGTVSEQLLHHYYAEIIDAADAVLDIHTGALWGYFRYAGVYAVGAEQASRGLAMSLGLPQVLVGQPTDESLAFVAAQAGKTVVSAWIGGGPGLRDYREEDAQRVRCAVYGALAHLGMLEADPPINSPDGPEVTVLQAHAVIRNGHPRGLVFMDKTKRCHPVAAGERLGYVRHPFTGETLHEITAPRAGVMLHAGGVWPMLHDNAILAILGDLL